MYAHKLAEAKRSKRSSFKYKSDSYEIRYNLWINKFCFKEANSKSLGSENLSAKRLSPFTVVDPFRTNAVKLELPSHVKIRDVINLIRTVPCTSPPRDMYAPITHRPGPTPVFESEENEVESTLSDRKRRKVFQFLTLMRGFPTHGTE